MPDPDDVRAALAAIAERVLALERALADILSSEPEDQSAVAERTRLRLALKAVADFLKDVSGATQSLIGRRSGSRRTRSRG